MSTAPPMHYLSEGWNGPLCCGTGHVRRFKATRTVSEVTCAKCKKVLDRRLARLATEIRNDVLGVA